MLSVGCLMFTENIDNLCNLIVTACKCIASTGGQWTRGQNDQQLLTQSLKGTRTGFKLVFSVCPKAVDTSL